MLFENKTSFRNEVKSASLPSVSFAEFLYNRGYYDLSALAVIRMYKDCTPFFMAVDMRATHFSSIPIKIWDKKAKKFIEDHEVMGLLENPNGDTTQTEFLYGMSSFLDITGNSFLYAGGRIERPPLELATIAPYNITFPGGGERFGILNVPNQIQYTGYQGSTMRFVSEEDRNTNHIRFIDSRIRDKELWHVRTFNPTRSGNSFWGMSRGQPAWLEMQQYLSGNKTNWSMLKRGTRISMAWINNRGEELTEKQWQRVTEESQKYSGDENAGGTPVLDGMDVKPIQSTYKDMQFKDLQDSMFERTMGSYQIPIPLVSSETMTLDNLKTSMLQLYDRAVIPQAIYFYAELTRFLLSRYKNSENLMFTYSDTDITALMERNIAITKEKKDIGVSTIDELRADVGDEPLPSGEGDVVYRPINEIPLGADSEVNDGDLSDPDEDDD